MPFTEQYARETEPGLEFPGTRSHTFSDYCYFSMAVATTFGATDVSITTPRMRWVVDVHTLVSSPTTR